SGHAKTYYTARNMIWLLNRKMRLPEMKRKNEISPDCLSGLLRKTGITTCNLQLTQIQNT
ncbi:MAG: hypothetical protein LBB90_08610, partial [Tannerella sp.]|nr:hypothetical protein [Tannerella sp.]